MNTHVHNPYTRSPRLRVSLTVEEAQQLLGALNSMVTSKEGFIARAQMTANQNDAVEQLRQNLIYASAMRPPRGIKGVTP